MNAIVHTLTFIILLLMSAHTYSAEERVPADIPTLIKRVETARQHLDIPAIGLTLIDKNDIIWSGALGEADRQSGREASTDTYFRIGSITKTFTALATLILVDDGLLSLDDKLHDIAPEIDVTNHWHDQHPIRIKHLLEHTSGLTELTPREFHNNRQLSLEDALSFNPSARTTRWQPGLHHTYTNVGAGLLSYVIEKKTGKKYEEFVEDRIFKPLGMSSASYFPEKTVLDTLATGYDSDGKSVIPYWHMFFRAFGAINLKTADMAPLIITLLNEGEFQGNRLLSEKLVRRMETPTTSLAARKGLTFGYGAGLYSYFRKGHIFYGHGGDADGFLARFGYNRESDMGYFVVINVFHYDKLRQIRHIVEDYIIRDLPAARKPFVQLSVMELEALTGTYRPATWRFEGNNKVIGDRLLHIRRDGNQLIYDNTGSEKRELIPVSRYLFRFPDESVATVAFVEAADGRFFLQGDDGNYIRIDRD